MAFFSAYIDESGTDPKSKFSVVSAAIAQNDSWFELEPFWNRSLLVENISEFHATDFNNGARQFQGWTPERKKSLSIKLVESINQHISFFVAYGAFNESYIKAESTITHYKTSIYTVLLEYCVRDLLGWFYSNEQEGITIHIENGMKKYSEAINAFAAIGKDPVLQEHWRIMGFGFLSKNGVVPFHVADFMAYELYRYGDNFTKPVQAMRKIRVSLEKVLKSKILKGKILTEDEIRDWIEFRKSSDEKWRQSQNKRSHS